jgi:CelD/BcsL family acetyltransferase involved in cellulose biosynthesis
MVKISQLDRASAPLAGTLVPAREQPVVPEHATPAGLDVYELNPLSDSRWDELVQVHPRASVFHSANWLRALHAVYGYEPVVLTTCAPSQHLTGGLVFCRIRSWLTGRRLVSLPFSDHCEPLIDRQDELDSVLRQMKEQVKAGEWKYLELRPLTYQPSYQAELSRFKTYQLHSLDLRVSEAQLFRNCHKDCVQRKIRRAERENLTYEEGHSESILQKFYELMVRTRKRQCLPPQPIGWFRGLIEAFGKDLKIRVASKDGIAVAGILTLSHNRSMVYKYGCSDPEFNRFGGTALLFWRTIQEAKDSGCEELDMGRSDIENSGLIAFKEHWGAVGKSMSYWTYPPRQAVPLSKWRKDLVKRVVSAAPDLALKAVGTVLYKHVG